jgi:hypothetical protein
MATIGHGRHARGAYVNGRLIGPSTSPPTDPTTGSPYHRASGRRDGDARVRHRLAVVFDYTNGFHDTANSIATSVATRALSPGWAILMATAFNFIGAFAGTAVAVTIGKGLVDEETTTQTIVAAALIGAIAWKPHHVATGSAELEQPCPDRRAPGGDDRRGPVSRP